MLGKLLGKLKAAAKEEKNEEEEEEEDNNIWSSFLKESSKRSQNQASTCIVVGDPNSGKKRLAARVCASEVDDEDELEMNEAQKEIVSYSYFDIDDRFLESATKVNMWCIGKHIFEEAFEIMEHSRKTDKMAIIIVVDLSSPDECVPTLTKWLKEVATFIKKYHSDLKARKSFIVKNAHVEYLKSARINKGDAAKNAELLKTVDASAPLGSPKKKPNAAAAQTTSRDGARGSSSSRSVDAGDADGSVRGVSSAARGEDGDGQGDGNDDASAAASGDTDLPSATTDLQFVEAYFGLPIVVVGCKLDSMPVANGEDARQARLLQGRLRSICMEAGAAFICTSAYSGVNCAALKKYLMHMLYVDQISMDLSLQDSLESTFIPAGFDTSRLISMNCAISGGDSEGPESADEQNPVAAGEIFKRSFLHPGAGATEKGSGALSLTDADDKSPTEEEKDKDDGMGPTVAVRTTEIEDEQEWLKKLQSFIHQVSAGGATSSRSVPGNQSSSNLAGMASLTLGEIKEEDSAGGSASSGRPEQQAHQGPHTPREQQGLPSSLSRSGSRQNSPSPASASSATGAAAASGLDLEGGGVGVAEMASGKASASAKHKPVGSSRLAHRASFRQPVAATDKKDAGDFFKNLLEGKSAKK